MLQYLDTVIAFVVILLGVSLFITILNQLMLTLLGSRGANLLWGITTLLGTLDPVLSQRNKDPKLSNEAEKIAAEVLRNPLVSDSLLSTCKRDIPILGWFTRRWRLATAITPEELVHSLINLYQLGTFDDGEKLEDKTKTAIQEALSKIDPEAERKVKMVLDTIKNATPGAQNQIDKLVQELGVKIQGSVGRIEVAFDSVMKRTSQRFTVRVRVLTVFLAFVIAFGAYLDSFEMVRNLWSSPDQRARLVDNRQILLDQASAFISVENSAVQGYRPAVPPQILKEAMKKLMATKVEEKEREKLNPPEFRNLDEAEAWLKQNKPELADEYGNLVFAEYIQHANKINADLQKAGFQIQPERWLEFKSLSSSDAIKRLIGMLVTAALLSMGAPFWFNVLKGLTNLRPIVANLSGKPGIEPTQS